VLWRHKALREACVMKSGGPRAMEGDTGTVLDFAADA
jgi:hypothetical protein